jgi:hypothetical protein
MYTVKYFIVVPHAVRYGTASAASPKKAYAEANSRAFEASAAAGTCESIGAEGYTLFRDGKKIYYYCDLF